MNHRRAFEKKYKLIKQAIDEGDNAELERQSKKENEDEEKKIIQEAGERIIAGKVPKRDKGKVVVHLDGTPSLSLLIIPLKS